MHWLKAVFYMAPGHWLSVKKVYCCFLQAYEAYESCFSSCMQTVIKDEAVSTSQACHQKARNYRWCILEACNNTAPRKKAHSNSLYTLKGIFHRACGDTCEGLLTGILGGSNMLSLRHAGQSWLRGIGGAGDGAMAGEAFNQSITSSLVVVLLRATCECDRKVLVPRANAPIV